MTPARKQRVGSGFRYTDLERLRIEWMAENGYTAERIATLLGRSVHGVRQHLWRTGLSLTEARSVGRDGEGEFSWAGL